MKPQTITIITDCRDDNTRVRQCTRVATLFPNSEIQYVGVSSSFSHEGALEAGGNIVDTIDALGGNPGIILVNVAPRNGDGKKWPNGTPFGWCKIGNTLIVGTVAGDHFSLLKKFFPEISVTVCDISEVTEHLDVSESVKNRLGVTQFRSFDFLPFYAKALSEGKKLPGESLEVNLLDKYYIWWVDCFGNCKTTLLAQDIDFEPAKPYIVRFDDGKSVELTALKYLKDVPNNETALIIGSSGIENKRFLEIIIQGQAAAKVFHVNSGTSFSLQKK